MSNGMKNEYIWLFFDSRVYMNIILELREISAISSETEVSGSHWSIPPQHFWLCVFGAPIIYVIPVA